MSEETGLTVAEAARLFATAWNRLEATVLEPWLAEDVVYESQHVFAAIESRADFMEYLTGKMGTVSRDPSAKVYAELGETRAYPGCAVDEGSCVVMAQGGKDDVAALVLFQVEGGYIARMDMCTVVPDPRSARRTGIYPR